DRGHARRVAVWPPLAGRGRKWADDYGMGDAAELWAPRRSAGSIGRGVHRVGVDPPVTTRGGPGIPALGDDRSGRVDLGPRGSPRRFVADGVKPKCVDRISNPVVF